MRLRVLLERFTLVLLTGRATRPWRSCSPRSTASGIATTSGA